MGTTIISVFGKHFDINIHAVRNLAVWHVPQFHTLFTYVFNLKLVGYFNMARDNVPSNVWKEKRPPGLAFVLVNAEILHYYFKMGEYFW